VPSATRGEPVTSPEEILQARSVINQVYIDDKIRDYIINVVHATHEPGAYGLKELGVFVQYCASPRVSIFLNLAARAHACGRDLSSMRLLAVGGAPVSPAHQQQLRDAFPNASVNISMGYTSSEAVAVVTRCVGVHRQVHDDAPS